MIINKKTVSLGVFILVALIDLIAVTLNKRDLELLIKPLIMPCLLLLYTQSVNKERYDYYYMFSVAFCALGDYFFLNENRFLIGLFSFLIASIFYSYTISRYIKELNFNVFFKNVLPFLVFLLIFMTSMASYLKSMLFPALIYGLAIVSLGSISFTKFQEDGSKESHQLVIGVFIFILSDVLIAVRMFLDSNLIFATISMGLYIISQYLIFKFFEKSN